MPHYHKRRIKTPILTLLCHIVGSILRYVSYFCQKQVVLSLAYLLMWKFLRIILNRIGGGYDITDYNLAW